MKSLNTFYDTLQVPRNATIAALRMAHKTLSERLQPGSNPEDPGAAVRQLQQVNKALEVLTHPHAREAYDAWLNQRKGALGDGGDVGVPTLPELVEPPSQASTKVSSETLAPLPTLDLDGFAAEVAAKASASARAATTTAQTPVPLPNTAAKFTAAPTAAPTATATPTASPAARPTPASVLPPPPAPQAASTPSTPSGFAETQPYHPSDVDDLPDLQAPDRMAAAFTASTTSNRPAASQPTAAQRSAPLKALDWLRERPIALIAAALLCVLLVAFAPWLWHAAFGVIKAEVPAAPALLPTYVEPPAEAVSAPAAVAEHVDSVEPAQAAEVPAETKSAAKAKPRKVVKRVAEPRRAQEPVAPVQQPEPVVAPVPVDPGGHSGYAPKCRWVTPTNWSCK